MGAMALNHTAVSAALARDGYTVSPTDVAEAAALVDRSGVTDAESLAAAMARLGQCAPAWAVRKAMSAGLPETRAVVETVSAPRPPAEDAIRDFFGVEEPTTRLPDRKGRQS